MNDTPPLLWQPDPMQVASSHLQHYLNWLAERGLAGSDCRDYQELWSWSVKAPADFWASLWDFFQILHHQPYTEIMVGEMPGTRWFIGSTLNYAEHIFRQYREDQPALLYASEQEPLRELSWTDLRQQVERLAAYLQRQGVQPGDCVAAYLPNTPIATVGFLAAAAIGAIWTSASPDFGADSVLERFAQVAPKVLLAVGGYQYGGKWHDRVEVVRTLQQRLPSLQVTLIVEDTGWNHPPATSWDYWQQALATPATGLPVEPVPFAHPLWVLYSSGTTGSPKAITHSHGGMLLEHLKYLHFQADVRPGERFFWFTTTGWMMWNFLHGALLTGATIVLYDGSPTFPQVNVLWELVEKARIQHFGVSAAYLLACMKLGAQPQASDLSQLRSIGSTGSPLPPEAFAWIYAQVPARVWLGSMSGGTDVCTAFVGTNPTWPVYQGEIQCRALGCALQAFDDQGRMLENEVGEMVITQPMPCMPIYFWNDPEQRRYRASYFEDFSSVWRHGDWVKITPRQGIVILGRSDATLNRQGIRIGTSEIYRAVEQLPAIRDSLVLHLQWPDGTDLLPLFVVLAPQEALTPALEQAIRQVLRQQYSPRHVPDWIEAVPDIPYTISGKKLELPVKKLLLGQPLEQAVNLGAVRNPEALAFFADLARQGWPIHRSGE